MALCRMEGKRKSSPRNSYENSAGSGSIDFFFCCTEAKRAQQLRIDELSRQEKESQSTVNQVMVQIQEVQGKVNSLNVSMNFVDLETPSSIL